MGIYDRDYVRNERGGGRAGGGLPMGSRLGRPGGWSFNTWLIAVNVAVFVVASLFFGSAGSPVLIDERLEGLSPGAQLVSSQEYINARTGQIATAGETRRVGTLLTRPLVEAESGRRVGVRTYSVQDPFTRWGHFSTRLGFGALEVWRLMTFQFLHAGIVHLGFNMIGLYFFGGLVEQYLGKKRYAAFYLMCGLCGGLLYLLLNLVGFLGVPLPGALGVDPSTPLVGASAGVFGVIIACAFIAPNSVVQLLIPPIPLKMRTFAYGYVALAAANLLLFKGANAGGDAAHIGGAVAGYFFIRRPHLLREFFDVFGDSSKPKSRPGPAPRKSPGRKRVKNAAGASEAEVDAVLEKVRQNGLHSLSEYEKKVLQRATDERRG